MSLCIQHTTGICVFTSNFLVTLGLDLGLYEFIFLLRHTFIFLESGYTDDQQFEAIDHESLIILWEIGMLNCWSWISIDMVDPGSLIDLVDTGYNFEWSLSLVIYLFIYLFVCLFIYLFNVSLQPRMLRWLLPSVFLLRRQIILWSHPTPIHSTDGVCCHHVLHDRWVTSNNIECWTRPIGDLLQTTLNVEHGHFLNFASHPSLVG